MPVEAGALLVIGLYGFALYVILVIAPRLSPDLRARTPWYRDVRLWASFVAVVQMIVYALFS